MEERGEEEEAVQVLEDINCRRGKKEKEQVMEERNWREGGRERGGAVAVEERDLQKLLSFALYDLISQLSASKAWADQRVCFPPCWCRPA